MATGFNAEQERLHNELLTELDCNFNFNDPGSAASFKMQITKPLGGPGVLGRCKTLFDVFRQLGRRDKLGILNYDVLKKAFGESNNEDIVNIIEEKEDLIRAKGSTGATRKRPALQNEGAPQAKVQMIEDVEADPSDGKFVEEDGLGYYQTDKKTGYLLILNFVEKRNYTEFDVDNLKKFFSKELLFEVDSPRDEWEDDFTTQQVMERLESARKILSDDYKSKKFYCFICVILSHGSQGVFKTKDGQVEIEKIREMFSNKKMSKFAGKPKVFFIQACQGPNTQGSVGIDDEADDEVAEETEVIDESDNLVAIPNDADVLFAYATTPGNKAFRRQGVGSWFIKECVNVFRELRERCHLEDMLVTVRERVALTWEKIVKDEYGNGKQMPYIWSTLTKRLRLRKSQI